MRIQDKQKVCMILVTHNNVKSIGKALNSITKGMRKPDQIIIGDNDSQDKTYDILSQILGAEKIEVDKRKGWPPKYDTEINGIPITIFRKKYTKHGHALNMTMSMAKPDTTVFGFLNPNDWYGVDKIFRSVDIFERYKQVACVVSDCDNHHADGRCMRALRNSPSMKVILNSYPYDDNFLIRRDVFPKLKSGFNEELDKRQDYDLLLRLAKVGLVYHIAEALHNHTILKEDKKTLQECEESIRNRLIKEIQDAQKK